MNTVDPKDHRGKIIKVGDTVAYNFSGEIAIGKVIRIVRGVPNKWGRAYKELIEIRMDAPKSGHISKVRSSKNVMVIDESGTELWMLYK